MSGSTGLTKIFELMGEEERINRFINKRKIHHASHVEIRVKS